MNNPDFVQWKPIEKASVRTNDTWWELPLLNHHVEVRLMQSHGTTPNIAAQAIKSTTRHGFLVALGWVAQRLNLAEILNRHLRIKQKTYTHTPVDKVVEALVAILGNCRYMKDLNFDPGAAGCRSCRSSSLGAGTHCSLFHRLCDLQQADGGERSAAFRRTR